MSWADVIDCFASDTYTVTRTVEATYTLGRKVAGSTSTLSVIASIQPVTGYDLENLPEGQHSENVRHVYTTTELKARQDGFAPDKFAIDSETWEVWRLERWEDGAETHYRATISRLKTP